MAPGSGPPNGRTVSPVNLPSPSSSRGEQRGSQSPDAEKLETSDLLDPDQKIKKRTQNRVAQRTYRNRMKQKVQDLERQLCEMRTRQQQQLYFTHDLSPPVPDGLMTFGPVVESLPPPMWQQQHQHQHQQTQYPMSPEMWPPIPPTASNYHLQNDTGITTHSSFMNRGFPRQNSYQEPTLMQTGQGASITQASAASFQPEMELHHCSNIPGLYGNDLHNSFNPHVDTGLHLRRNPQETDDEQGPTGLQFSTSWEGSPTVLSPGSSRAGTVSHQMASPWGSAATAPTDASEEGVPNHSSSVETRFEYVLECARRVGFDTFDNMAAQYYASSFDPNSSLAMDQRVSRNRHLPALLSEIQERSADWSAWERRGYQDEALKIAESICAAECREFRSWRANGTDPGVVCLATIQQKLPNIWALLTSLASATPLQRQSDRSNLVFSSINQLCALGDASSQVIPDV